MTLQISAALAMTALAFTPAAHGQDANLQILASVARADHRVDAGFGVERSTGLLLGGAVRWRLRRGIALTGSADAGHLTAVAGTGGIDRDVAQLGLLAEFVPLPWLALETGVTVRSFGTVVARQRWTAVRAGAQARVPLSGEVVWAVGRLHLAPLVAVNGLPRPATAFDAGAGLGYQRGRLVVDVTYTLERYDFPWEGTVRRREQLAVLVIRGGTQLRLR